MPKEIASPALPVTLIVTTLNEERSLPALLRSISAQTRLPGEVVVVDAGSRDGTVALMQDWARTQPYPVRVLVEPGCNIAQGRNRAIEASSHSLIAVTDAGVHLEPTWLAALAAPFSGNDPPEVVGGLFQGRAEGIFHTAMCATVLPLPAEIAEGSFLPSSRSVAFTKAAWRRVGGYPQWATFCEDLLFDMALLASGQRMVIARDALVHFAPRRSLAAFWRQYRNYAMGDGLTNLYLGRHLARYATYLGLIPLLGWASVAVSRWWLLGYLLGAAVYLRRPFQRLTIVTRGWPWKKRLGAGAWVPLIRLWGDVAKMVGYPLGLPRGLLLRHLNKAYKAGRLRRRP